MSYEIEMLKRDIETLKWQKAESWIVERLEQKTGILFDKIRDLENKNSYIEERLRILEQKELERENT